MKNTNRFLILSNLIWILLLFDFTLKSCNVPQERFTSDEGDVVLNYTERDFNSLPLGAAKIMAENYYKTDVPSSKGLQVDGSFEDARSIWFSLEELENFMWIIRNYTDNDKISVPAKDLGVRVYYGRYPDLPTLRANTDFKGVNFEYANMHTVFMVPTYKDGDQQIDFDPQGSFSNGKLTPLSEEYGGDILKVGYESPAILNHGNLCPPCNH